MDYLIAPTHNPLWGRVVMALRAHGHHARDVVAYESHLKYFAVPRDAFRWHDLTPLMLGQIDGVRITAAELDGALAAFDSRGVERQCLDMFGRFERFSYLPGSERQSIFRLYVAAALEILRPLPAFVLFPEPPHFPFTFVLREVARARGIRVVEFNSNPIAPTLFLTVDDAVQPAPLAEPLPRVAQAIEDWLQRTAGDYRGARPAYMKDQEKKSGLLRLDRVRRMFRSEPPLPGEGREKLLVEFHNTAAYSSPRERSPAGHAFVVRRARRALREFYESRARNLADIPRPFVYMPMHFQPERTSNPEGGVHYDQREAALFVRRLLPPQYHLALREHPSQFMMMRAALGYRSQNYYRALEAAEGVSLLSTREDPFAVTQAAAELVTIAGNAALEAALRGVPASYLGNAWYRGAPGIAQITGTGAHAWATKPPASLKTSLGAFLAERVGRQPLAAINPSNVKYWKATFGYDESQAQVEVMAQMVARATR